ncbi:KinB signaling pathway activation protein OS=Ureibacillus acetophenoni OX=614649 GN=SAMN05877842_1053 PE=4 SV=1 [Ureibacillus acetophenoni]
MTIRNWIKFFLMCVIIGGIVTGVAGIFIRWNFFQPYLAAGEIGEFFAAFGWMILLGVTMSVIAQAGYFAYLTLHQVGVGVFKTLTLWNWVQVLLIAIVIFDLIVFRFAPGAQSFQDWLFYGGLLVFLIFAAIATAVKKGSINNEKAHFSFFFIFHDCRYIIRMDYRTNGSTR